MVPIQDVLHRIQWDPEFGKADFEIGYLDRLAGHVVRVWFRDVRFQQGDHPALQAMGEDGAVSTIPLHRVREVWRDGVRIWRRPRPRGVAVDRRNPAADVR